MNHFRYAVMGSGAGTNFQNVLEAIADERVAGQIVCALTDDADSGVAKKAAAAGIPLHVLDCRGHWQKFPDEAQREAAYFLRRHGADYLLLAGFMRIVGRPLLESFPEKILNIHPSLLPHFPGREAWVQALDAKAAVTGCTVHFVDDGVDTGPIIHQEQVPVLKSDTAESLHARIQQAEQRAYPAALRWLSKNRISEA